MQLSAPAPRPVAKGSLSENLQVVIAKTPPPKSARWHYVKGEKERQGLKMSRIITYSSAVGEPGFEFLFRISPLFFPEHSHGQLFQFVFYLPQLMPMVATCNDRPNGKGRLTKIEAENCLATEV